MGIDANKQRIRAAVEQYKQTRATLKHELTLLYEEIGDHDRYRRKIASQQLAISWVALERIRLGI
jgi:hypothetical protein